MGGIQVANVQQKHGTIIHLADLDDAKIIDLSKKPSFVCATLVSVHALQLSSTITVRNVQYNQRNTHISNIRCRKNSMVLLLSMCMQDNETANELVQLVDT